MNNVVQVDRQTKSFTLQDKRSILTELVESKATAVSIAKKYKIRCRSWTRDWKKTIDRASSTDRFNV